MNRLKLLRARIAFTALVVVVAAIGAGAAVLAASASTRTARVTVIEREYKITLPKRTFSPGTVRFVIGNRGKIAHSLAIRGPGVSRRVTGTIPPGGHRTLNVRLEAGTYKLWCPVPGHAALGMKTTLHVKGSSPAATTTSTTGGGAGWG